MIGKKINQLATELAPVSTDLTIIGDPDSGVSKKVTLAQLGAIFGGAVAFYTNLASFPATGSTDIIYCAKDTQKLYLWSGSAYTEVFPSQALLNTYQLRSEKGVSNGYASLDSTGKVPISQLPSSIMEYKGTWNAATNTPTLANGTGDTGDVYICNVAGTVNFGAGPITFAVGDYTIYSGSIWQRSSGAVGTVTSVGLSTNGNSITIGSSPVTTSGTISANFVGNSTQYINGAGNLVTFPSIISQAANLVTEVYNSTGATLTKGTIVYINGGQGNLPTVTKALATGDSTSAQTFGVVQADITNNNNGYVVVAGKLSDLDTQAYTAGTQLYLSSTTAGTWTSTKQFAPNHLVYVGIVVRSHPTQGIVEVKIQNGYELDELHDVAVQTPSNNDGLFFESSTSLWKNKSIATILGYTPQAQLTLTTTGTSGAATLVGATLNIPQYQSVLTNPVTGTGTTNTLPKFTGASTIGNSNITDTGSLITLGSATRINGNTGIGGAALTTFSVGALPTAELGSTSYGSAVIQGVNYTLSNTQRGILDINFNGLTTIDNGSTLTFTNNAGQFLQGYNYVGAALKAGKSNATNQNQSTYLSFHTNGSGTLSERLRLTSGGALLLGTTSSTATTFVIGKDITGAASSYGTLSNGLVKIDVSSNAYNYASSMQTDAAGWTLPNYFHYSASQGTIGAGSVITNQYGFSVDSTLTGATNNFGFYGNIPAGTGRWNLYMNGTANNYLAGALGIGTPNPQGNLHVGGGDLVLGGTTGQIRASSATFGTGGAIQVSASNTVANQYVAFGQALTGTGAFTERMRLVAGSGNLLLNTTTDAGFRLDVNGTGRFSNNLTIGQTSYLAGTYSLDVLTGGIAGIAEVARFAANGNGGTGRGSGIVISASGSANTVSVVRLVGYQETASATANNASFAIQIANSSGTLTEYFKLNNAGNLLLSGQLTANSFVPTSSTIPTNGMYLSGTNTLGFATNGTLDMVINEVGSVGIGTTALTGYNLRVLKNITGAGSSYGISSEGVIQSDATLNGFYYNTVASTAAATFTTGNIVHYFAQQGTFGAGSTVTRQYGFFAAGSLIGGTNNFGFYGDIASGTNRWNLYMNGTANNYMAGSLGIGVTAPLAPLQLGNGYTETEYDGFRNTGSPSFLMAYGQTSIIHRILGGVYSQASTINLDLSLAISKNKGTGSGFRITSGVGTGVGTSNNYLSFSSLTGAIDETFTATEYMRLNANGSLGIGTTSPAEKLDVIGGALAAGNGTIRTGITYSSLGLIGTFTNHDLGVITNGSERMRITSGGNVGIGTTSIRNNGAGQTAMQITGADFPLFSINGTSTGIGLNFGTGSATGYIGTYTNHGFNFFTNDTERMRILNGGEVCIGRTTAYSAGFLLSVEGNIYASAALNVGTTIQTGAPTGGTAQSWRLGEDTNTLYTATRTIRVEIAGSVYYLLAVKSSDL